MKKEEKIFLEKEDDIEKVEEEVKNSLGEKVILNIPKNSVLSISVRNFRQIKKLEEELGKEIVIESIDEKVLDLSALAGILAYNPVFRKKETIIADIIPQNSVGKKIEKRKKKEEDEEKDEWKEEKENKEEEGMDDEYEEEEEEDEEIYEEDLEEKESELERVLGEREYKGKKIHILKRNEKKRKKILSKRKVFVGGAILFVLLVILGVFTYVLPKLSVTLTLKKSQIDFNTELIVSTKAGSDIADLEPFVSTSSFTIPGQVISAQGNLNSHFEGEGKEVDVKSKATGTLVVYNYYSSSPQTLVAKTRFMSPDGKVFRAVNKVVIPGFSKDKKGNIIPGSVEVEVIADDFGESYNIGPATNWTIPGLKGLPQYEKIYAENKNYMKGGFLGKRFEPSEEYLNQSRNKIREDLKNNLENQIAILDTKGFNIIPEATVFDVLKEEIKGVEEGGFDIFLTGVLKKFVFDEKYLEEKLIKSSGVDKNLQWKVVEFKPSYSVKKIDFEKGEMILNASGTIVFEPQIDIESLKKKIAGKNSDEVRKEVSLLRGLESADISFWPFWVYKAPYNLSNIEILLK